jgi:hypothetical protein
LAIYTILGFNFPYLTRQYTPCRHHDIQIISSCFNTDKNSSICEQWTRIENKWLPIYDV